MALSVLMLSCSPSSKSQKTPENGSSIAFIEYISISEGKSLNGNTPAGRSIGQPTYKYSDNKIEISQNLGNVDPNSATALFGEKHILKGTSGSGISSILHGVTKTPYSSNGLTIIKIDADKIQVNFNGEKIDLKAGGIWQNITTQLDTINISEKKYIVETTLTQKICFHGIIDRANILLN